MTDRAEQSLEPTALMLGRFEGRIIALEDRMDRHEAVNSVRLTAIETKLDHISNTLAQGLGGMRLIHWIAGAALACAGFFASHFSQSSK
jgi:hypothetical protein